MTTTITKATSRGQITIPKAWRKKFKTNSYILKAGDFKLEVVPMDEEELEWLGAETIFNADRDNNGQGIEAGEFLKILRSIKDDGQNKKISGQTGTKRSRAH